MLECYRDFLDVFVIDRDDADIDIKTGGVEILFADTMMTSVDKSVALSRIVLDAFA